MTIQTLEYNEHNDTISLNTYSDDECLESSTDVTEQATDLVLERLFKNYDVDTKVEVILKKIQLNIVLQSYQVLINMLLCICYIIPENSKFEFIEQKQLSIF